MKTLKLSILLFSLLLFTQIGFSQNKKVKFGKVEVTDLAMQQYDRDPDAEALVLYDFGESKIEYQQRADNGFALSFDRHIRIKILKESGKRWADFSIPLYKSTKGAGEEKVRGLKATTYNLDGKNIVEDKLSLSETFKEEKNANWTLTKIAMPNVKVGSIIEIKYTVESDFIFNFREWNFEYSIPCVWSEYKTEIPEYFSYHKNMKGYHLDLLTINKSEVENGTINIRDSKRSFGNVAKSQTEVNTIDLNLHKDHWVAENMPALREEAYMLNVDDYLTGIEFELAMIRYPGEAGRSYATDWPEIQSDLYLDFRFGEQFKQKGWVKDFVSQINASATSPEEKIATAYDLVRSKMQWDERYRFLASSNLKKTFEEGKGSAADINLTLVLLLQELGLQSAPVLVSTRKNGRISVVHPSISQFNYVIAGVKVGDKEVLLDATSRTLPVGLLPIRCLNDKGRWIGKERNDWVNLMPRKTYSETTQMELSLTENKTLTGTINQQLKDYGAYYFRNEFHQASNENQYFEDWVKEYEGFEVQEHAVENIAQLNEKVRVKMTVNFEEQMEEANDLLFFTPLLIFANTENPFKQKERLYPVSFPYPKSEKIILKFIIPEGYMVEGTPEDLAMGLPDKAAKFIYTTKILDDFILVTSHLKISKLEHLSNDYSTLKTFYDKMIEKQTEQLVLKRK